MTEHLFRHGLYLTSFFSVNDPIFPEEPLVRTHNWMLNTNANMARRQRVRIGGRVGRQAAWLGAALRDGRARGIHQAHNLPFKATLGGKEPPIRNSWTRSSSSRRKRGAGAKLRPVRYAPKAPTKKCGSPAVAVT